MTQFAGTLTGAVTEEQLFINNQWVTYRTRGGSKQQDAFFAPSTKTPYTDDLTLGYQADLGRNMSFETTYTNRRTRDVLEDYDLTLYAEAIDGTNTYPGNIDAPGSLWLGLDYFGYAAEPGIELRHRHARGGQARLPRRGPDLPQALQRQLAGARVVHLQPRLRQLELGFERGLPGRRALSRSARAERLRPAAREHPAHLQVLAVRT